MTIQFRILDSDLYGASIDIEENKKYQVGDSFQYDIFIQAPAIGSAEGSNYFEFSVEKNKILFFNSSGNVTYIDYLNHSKNFISQEYTYEVPCLFEFLGVTFVLCDMADSWEKWTNLMNIKQSPVENNPFENPEMSDEELKMMDNMYARHSDKNAASLSSKKLQKKFPILLKIFGKNQRVVAAGSLIVFLLVAGVIAYTSVQKYTSLRTSHSQQIASVQDMQSIKEIEVNLPARFNNIRFLSNQNDIVVVEGVVKNMEDVLFLKKSFEKFKNIVQFKLLTASEAINKLNLILKMQNANLVTPAFNDSNYRLSLSGLIKSMDIINEIELAVSNQIPEVSDLDTSRVFSASDVERDSDELLTAANLNSRLTLKKNLAERTINIDGYLSRGEIADLKNSVANLVTKYQGLITVNVNVKDALSSLPFKIVSVNTSGFPSFMTDTGQKVFEGGEVNGIKVDKISTTEIIFSGKFPLILKLDDALGAGTASGAN